MRRVWIVSGLVVSACAGGQTGEITELTACDEAIGAVPIEAPSEAGRSAGEQLEALTTRVETELSWQPAGSPPSTLAVSFVLSGEPATLMGGAECMRPWLAAPVTVTIRTADGALDETIEGTALLNDTESASVQASIAIQEMNGALDAPAASTLRVDLLAEPDGLSGQLSLRAAAEDADDTPLASF